MHNRHIAVPDSGRRIGVNPDFSLIVPETPIIPFIEGDGIGVDVTPAMRRVVDAAVEKAYRVWEPIYEHGRKLRMLTRMFPGSAEL